MGTLNGLWKWKPGPPRFYSVPGEVDGIQALTEDTDGALLVGWKGGIYRFVDGKTESYPLPGAVGKFRAHRLLRDANGGLWVGTRERGLLHVHEGRTDVFSVIDGFSGDDVSALLEDREGNVWTSTLEGFDRFRDFAVTTFSVKQGLLKNLVVSALADKDEGVWLATYGGLNRWERPCARWRTITRPCGLRPWTSFAKREQ